MASFVIIIGLEKTQIALLKNRLNIYIQILNCITHLSVLKSQLFRFNFILPADSSCKTEHSTTLLLQPLDIVIKL